MRTPDIMEIIERLESQVVSGRRVMSKVMVDESEFFALLDQLRQAVPAELQQARRIIQQRQEIILDAQEEAEKIVSTARERAEYLISERGLSAEARYVGENVLRHAHENADAAVTQMTRFVSQMLDDIEAVMKQNRLAVEDAVNRNLTDIEEARMRLPDRA
ncbi:MAG TPA: hypothetical protein PKA95_06885 [Thermomicrobiales bacterium]|nr:hypothetical protein [Thermomicrobiales bacterium]